MTAIENWVVNNPKAAVISFFATIIALVIAIVVPLIQRRRKKLSYTAFSTMLVDDGKSKINGLNIRYKGVDINNLCITKMKIINNGNVLIEGNDFHVNHDLKIKTEDDITILGVDIISTSVDTICPSIDESLIIHFQAFEKNDWMEVDVYHTGNQKTEVILDGKLKEGNVVDYTKIVEAAEKAYYFAPSSLFSDLAFKCFFKKLKA